MKGKTEEGVGTFERHLSIWVLLCMAAGVAVSQLAPAVPAALNRMEVYGQNVPIAVLVWVMIFPMMAKVAFAVVLFVAVPLAAGVAVRRWAKRTHGPDWLEAELLPRFDGFTTAGLLLTLVIIFSSQGQMLVDDPLSVALIAMPLVCQNVISTALTYAACRAARLPYEVTAPASLIAASDFFELSVAVAVSLFGTGSPVALACTVGVLTEVPVMLGLVWAIRATRPSFAVESTMVDAREA